MGFNRFATSIILRSILLALNALILALFAVKTNWVFTFFFLCLLFVLQVYLLIRYSSKVNRDLANFLIHLKEQDTTLAFSKNNLIKNFSGLSKQFERINQEISKIKGEKIRNRNFLDLLLNRVGTGILVINNKDEVILCNKALLSLFGISESTSHSFILKKIHSSIHELATFQPGDQKIGTIHVLNLTRRLFISYTEIKEDNDLQRIYSFHDIDREITDYELQSWNGLLKVLSHEIMNTITPLSTVIDTLNDCLTINGIVQSTNQLDQKDLSDSVKAIRIIESRISGLKNFIVRFRQFSDIPLPECNEISVNEFIKNQIELYETNFSTIQFTNETTQESITINADKSLLELVFTNILKNAIESFSTTKNPSISIKSYTANNYVIIEICDNGQGIEDSIIQKVFLPFFTTKKEGSGIGLSLARQIMFSHNGNIEIDSDTKGTCVRLIFNQENSSRLASG